MIYFRKALFITALLIFPRFVSANTLEDKLLDCMKKVESERLACFEDLTRVTHSEISTAIPTEDAGKWKIRTETSPLDDSKNVYMSLDADDPLKGRYGRSITPTVMIRCKENKTEMYVSWGMFLGSDEVETVYRIDKEKAQSVDWGISTDRKASFVSQPISFIKKMFDKDALLLMVTPYGESPVTSTFTISGLKSAIVPLQEACHWSP